MTEQNKNGYMLIFRGNDWHQGLSPDQTQQVADQWMTWFNGLKADGKCVAGTPNEMVTMYYDQDGKLAMKHYCVFGNRPGMLLKSSDADSIEFEFDPTCGINPNKESHMHALTITFDDANTITTSCVAMMDGQVMPENPMTLKRVKE